jgi:hypothetical protein
VDGKGSGLFDIYELEQNQGNQTDEMSQVKIRSLFSVTGQNKKGWFLGQCNQQYQGDFFDISETIHSGFDSFIFSNGFGWFSKLHWSQRDRDFET